MTDAGRRRRKEDRPGEIVEAALRVFAEKGYAAARMEDIAARAGVSKGAVYLYFANKEEVFHAVVLRAAGPNVERVRAAAANFDGPFAAFVAGVMEIFTASIAATPLGAIAKMVIGESRNFPTLARDWHDSVVTPMLAILCGVIERAQEKGQVRPGDPRLYAFQLMSPLVMSVIWRETFAPVGGEALDLPRLAKQHLEVLSRGMLTPDGAAA